jgi:hypothetical protein
MLRVDLYMCIVNIYMVDGDRYYCLLLGMRLFLSYLKSGMCRHCRRELSSKLIGLDSDLTKLIKDYEGV